MRREMAAIKALTMLVEQQGELLMLLGKQIARLANDTASDELKKEIIQEQVRAVKEATAAMSQARDWLNEVTDD